MFNKMEKQRLLEVCSLNSLEKGVVELGREKGGERSDDLRRGARIPGGDDQVRYKGRNKHCLKNRNKT
jgi:hypothetical protein